MTDPWARPEPPGRPLAAPQPFPESPPPGYPAPPPAASPPKGSSPLVKIRNLFRDPLSIVLVVIIIVALTAAGLLAGELYARSRADAVVARVAECVIQDNATVSFDALPPFLLQHLTGHYTNINIQTAGNQIRQAKGMKVALKIQDVRLEDTADSSGSLGSLNATVTWSAEGIKQTVQDSIPLVGSFLTGVTTNPGAGTLELQGALGSITAKPEVVDNGISLQVVGLTGLGFTLPGETVQPALDAFTAQLTKNYPMGIHADAVQVTDTGVVSQFSTRNASIPKSRQDACFAGL